MAGQPPEPSFQPSGQDQALTQGRPAWQQQPPYTPPPGAPAGQPGYGAPAYPPQDQAYGQQEQAYPPPEPPAYPGADQGYSGQDQTYTSLGQGQAKGQSDHSAARDHHIRVLQNFASIALKKYANSGFCLTSMQNHLPVFESLLCDFPPKIMSVQGLSQTPESWPAS